MSGDEREAYRSRARDDQKRYKAEQADKVTDIQHYTFFFGKIPLCRDG